jgi:hypothetical protein
MEMKDLMASSGELATELNLKRVSRVVVDGDPERHRSSVARPSMKMPA